MREKKIMAMNGLCACFIGGLIYFHMDWISNNDKIKEIFSNCKGIGHNFPQKPAEGSEIGIINWMHQDDVNMGHIILVFRCRG
jgi:hypothetical protein